MDESDVLELPSVDLAFQPQLDQVSMVREFLESYFEPALNDPDLLSRMAIAAHELLENAAKYSAGGFSRLRIGLKNGTNPMSLSVSVSNVAAPEHVEGLKHTVQELTEAADPSITYLAYLARAAKRREGSGLGLARIRAEADMTLMLHFKDGRVCVEALAPLARKGET